MAAGGVGVRGAQQPKAACRGERPAQQRVEGVLAAAVGGDGDPGPGAVGSAGARAPALDRGREEFVDGDAAVLAQRQGEKDDVGARGSLACGGRGGTRSQHVDDERDPLRVTRAGDQHVVPGGDGEPGEHGADLAGAEDAESGHVAL